MKDEIAGTIYAKEYTDWHIKTGGFAKDMTLRDHFAGLAMQAMILSGNIPVSVSDAEIADLAYKMADLMLKERAK